MANEEHLEILRRGAEAWNQWRGNNSSVRPNFSQADLREANLSGADLSVANLSRADLSRADLSKADLILADLSGAKLSGANLSKAKLIRTNLSETILSDTNLSRADLSEVDLSRAKLSGADLSGADLSGGVLSGADLIETDLSGAKLIRADLSGAVLSGAVLNRANLVEADLSGAKLRGTNLSGTDLSKADLHEAQFIQTILADVNLSETRGLDSVVHHGPSSIGIDTIYRSGGKLPLAFLRGCGLSDIQIEMVKLHRPELSAAQITDILYHIHNLRVDGAIQYYSSFISYAHQDRPFVDTLHHDLQENGVRCWYAPQDLPIGARIRAGIDEAIRLQDKLVLILSEYSVASDWVEKEVEAAFEKEREYGEPVLLPILLDDSVMKIKEGWPADIRRARHIGDFCKWKNHDEYQKAFKRLLRNLKAEPANG